MVGLIDTDFNFRRNIALSCVLKGLFLIRDMEKVFKQNGISYNLRLSGEYGYFYIRKKGSIKIIEEWGLKNLKHLSKYNLLKKFGKFIPFSTTPERLAVLGGKLDIEELEKVCKKRAPVKAR